jgi:hypothetical protein
MHVTVSRGTACEHLTLVDISTGNSTHVDIKITYELRIAACLVAAIRVRGEPIKPSTKLSATIYDSVRWCLFGAGCNRTGHCLTPPSLTNALWLPLHTPSIPSRKERILHLWAA